MWSGSTYFTNSNFCFIKLNQTMLATQWVTELLLPGTISASFISLRINQKPENMYKKHMYNLLNVQSREWFSCDVIESLWRLEEWVHKGNLKNVPFPCQDRSWLNPSLNEQMYMYYYPTWEKAFAIFRSRISFKTLSTTPKTTGSTFFTARIMISTASTNCSQGMKFYAQDKKMQWDSTM